MNLQRIEDEILSIASIYEDSFKRDVPTAWQVCLCKLRVYGHGLKLV